MALLLLLAAEGGRKEVFGSIHGADPWCPVSTAASNQYSLSNAHYLTLIPLSHSPSLSLSHSFPLLLALYLANNACSIPRLFVFLSLFPRVFPIAIFDVDTYTCRHARNRDDAARRGRARPRCGSPRGICCEPRDGI